MPQAKRNSNAVEISSATGDDVLPTKVPCILNGVDYDTPEGDAILKERVRVWFVVNPPDPRGQKMYKRVGPYKVMMFSKDVVLVAGVGIRTAQRILERYKKALNKKKNDYITVEEFCFLGHYNETLIRKVLEEAYAKNPGLNKTED